MHHLILNYIMILFLVEFQNNVVISKVNKRKISTRIDYADTKEVLRVSC